MLPSDCYCGFISFEEVEASDLFVRRFFVLNHQSGRLEYFEDDAVLAPDCHHCQPLGFFNINFISFISDASSSRPKLQNGFYIVVSGNRHFFSASSITEKQEWMRRLQDASKIHVPSPVDVVTTPQRNGCRVQIVGGVAHMTSLDETANVASRSSSSINIYSGAPARQDSIYYKIGYCIKLGGVRKNWKRRYFVLDSLALNYYASHQDKLPIKTVPLSDIKEARFSVGVHVNKQHLFEVVTPCRVFYIQAESADERDAWVKAINNSVGVKDVVKRDASTQTIPEERKDLENTSKFRFRMTSV